MHVKIKNTYDKCIETWNHCFSMKDITNAQLGFQVLWRAMLRHLREESFPVKWVIFLIDRCNNSFF